MGLDDKEMLVSLEVQTKDTDAFHKKHKEKWLTKLGTFLKFDKKLGCSLKSPKWKLNKNLLEAEVEVQCLKSMKGSELEIKLQSFFPELKSIRVKLLSPPKGLDETFESKDIKITL